MGLLKESDFYLIEHAIELQIENQDIFSKRFQKVSSVQLFKDTRSNLVKVNSKAVVVILVIQFPGVDAA